MKRKQTLVPWSVVKRHFGSEEDAREALRDGDVKQVLDPEDQSKVLEIN